MHSTVFLRSRLCFEAGLLYDCHRLVSWLCGECRYHVYAKLTYKQFITYSYPGNERPRLEFGDRFPDNLLLNLLNSLVVLQPVHLRVQSLCTYQRPHCIIIAAGMNYRRRPTTGWLSTDVSQKRMNAGLTFVRATLLKLPQSVCRGMWDKASLSQFRSINCQHNFF